MYYSYPCSHCGRLFYTFNDIKMQAAATLYNGIMEHMKSYNEENKEVEFEQDPEDETNNIYSKMSASNEIPSGGYELE